MPKKWIFLTGLLLCLIVAAVVYYSYNKPRAGVENKSVAYKLEAKELYKEFANNEAAANAKYNGKVLAVTGKIIDIQKDEDALLIVLDGANGGGISCSFTPPLPKNIPALHSVITVKGRCTGFLMDVNLVDAVLVSKTLNKQQ